MRHSYTKISMWMQCPFKKKARYELGVKEQKHPAAQRGTDIHKQFEEAIVNGSQLPDEFRLYGDYVARLREAGASSELKVGVDRSWAPVSYESPDAWLIGVLDLWITMGRTAIGLDWKTGKEYPDHLKQKEFYCCLLADAHPMVEEFIFTNVYLDLGKNSEHRFTRNEVVNTLRPRWSNRIAVMERDTDCVPTPNFMCRYCAASKAKGGPCPF